MPRLTAARRLGIMSAAIALAEDGDGAITLNELAERLGEEIKDVRESLEPLRWVELRTPEGVVDRVDWISVEDDLLYVDRAWWRRLAALTPAEAARLYVKAAAAASLGSSDRVLLGTAMAKLRRMVGVVTVMEGELPVTVRTLREAQWAGQAVVVALEGKVRTIVTSDATFSVNAVYRDGAEWMVTLAAPTGNRDARLAEGEALTVPVRHVLMAIPSLARVEEVDAGTSTFDPRLIDDVVVEFPTDRDWVVAHLDPVYLDASVEGFRRCRISLWGTPELKTLLLRLGPDARVIEPDSLTELRAKAAGELLQLYS